MSRMFYNCPELKTIYVSNDWTVDNVTASEAMFFGCTKLVGGQGTTYNEDLTSKKYARIDGGKSNPGYFTLKADEIARLRSAGKPVSAEEYSRLENELTNLVERLEFFRDRWQEMRRRWEKGKKGGIIERQSFKSKPVTIHLLEMHEKRIRDCLDGR